MPRTETPGDLSDFNFYLPGSNLFRMGVLFAIRLVHRSRKEGMEEGGKEGTSIFGIP